MLGVRELSKPTKEWCGVGCKAGILDEATRRLLMHTRTSLVSVLFALSATSVSADWPTDIASPLVVGSINNGFDERVGIRSGADGSVWLAWQQAYCVGDLRLQHVSIHGDLLSPTGLAIQEDPTCGFHVEPLMGVIGESVVVARGSSSLLDTPVQRFGMNGSALWGSGFVSDEPLSVQGVLAFENGDALIASLGFGTIHIDRVDSAGNPVWSNQLVFDSPTGANFDIVDLVADDEGGAYVFWDSPATYVRRIHAMRVTSDGQTAWANSVRVVDATSPSSGGASRHTHSRMVSDGAGGAIVVYSEGFEQGTTPAAMFMQRVMPDGSLAYAAPGARVSMRTDRQFDVDLQRDSETGDVFVTWRDGFFDGQTVCTQRLSTAGDRLWGDEGIELGALERTTGSFDSIWNHHQLQVAIADSTGIEVLRLNGSGAMVGQPIGVAASAPSSFVKIAGSGRGSVIAWQVDVPSTLDDLLVAQRINRTGMLGGDPCNLADFTSDGELSFFDVSAFLSAFTKSDPIADLTGEGELNFFDVSVFLSAFGAGCLE